MSNNYDKHKNSGACLAFLDRKILKKREKIFLGS